MKARGRPFRFAAAVALAVVVPLAACVDAPTSSRAFAPTDPALSTAPSTAYTLFERYVAIGTSVSMGFASEGVMERSQEKAWPVQLSRLAARAMSAPYVASPGCRSPFAAPLASGLRVSGEPAGAPAASLACAPSAAGVALPVRNTAMNAARAYDALYTTPENTPDAGNKALYARVLPPNTTQVQAMARQYPTFVSVELGANEVLGARDGRVIPGVTVVPPQYFATDYQEIVARVARYVGDKAILTGLINDAASFPAFRRGWELWRNRGEFLAAFNVKISGDCEANQNLIVVPFRVPAAVATGLTMKAKGLGVYDFSCAAGPPNVTDYVLDPSEVAMLNQIMRGITAYIQATALQRGFAYFDLDALYARPNLKPTFSVVALMTTAQPYGPYMSLDGFHPSAQGQAILANAAAKAINARYGTLLKTF